jgi:hypothetical protein
MMFKNLIDLWITSMSVMFKNNYLEISEREIIS